MKYQNPLKLILARTMPHWGRAETRPSVHAVFDKAIQCRTAELGGKVSVRRTKNSFSITRASREPARVVATSPTYSGYASGGPLCEQQSDAVTADFQLLHDLERFLRSVASNHSIISSVLRTEVTFDGPQDIEIIIHAKQNWFGHGQTRCQGSKSELA